MTTRLLSTQRIVNIADDPATGTAGEIYYNTTNNVLRYHNGTAWTDFFATQIKHLVKNDSGVTLNKGTVVYTSGANGTNILVKAAQASTDQFSAQTLGFLESTLAPNGIGYVVTNGLITGINTSSASAGSAVWLSPTTPGGVIYGLANKPKAPDHLVYLGVVTRSNVSNGEIFIHISNGWEIEELHDVRITSASANHIINYNAASAIWVNENLATVIGRVDGEGSGIDADLLDGQHGSYYLDTSSSTQTKTGNLSIVGNLTVDTNTLFVDAANNRVGIGTTSPSSFLYINSSIPTTTVQVIQGAASQSSALTEWRDSAGSILTSIRSNGNLGIGRVANSDVALDVSGTLKLRISGETSNLRGFEFIPANHNADNILRTYGSSGGLRMQAFQTASGNTQAEINFNPGGFLSFSTSNTVTAIERMRIVSSGLIGIGTNNPSSLLHINNSASATIGMIVQGASGQTANLQEWRNSSGTVLASMSASGNFLAVTKSFDISHPTKRNMRLRYGSLEGPEHGVYIRGRGNSSHITLPDYWVGLIDEDTITVQITPIGGYRKLYVKNISHNTVEIGGVGKNTQFFYFIQAERKDIDKLVVEYGS